MDASLASSSPSSGAVATVTWERERVVVTLAGELDATFTQRGESLIRVLADQDRPVDLDLEGVTLCSAAGVNWLVSLYSTVEVEVGMVAASDAVQRVLALCGVPTRSPGRSRLGQASLS